MLILVSVFVLQSTRAQDVPKLERRVTDITNTLSASEINALDSELKAFEDSTSNQIVVLMIPTLGEQSLEDFALRTAQSNGVGGKKNDNGALLLVVKDDRKLRIEVGYGLEGTLTDALSSQIIRREITPSFRSGDYYTGIKAGVEAMMLATRNEYKAEKEKPTNSSGFFVFLLFLLIFIFIARNSRRKSGGVGVLPFLIASSMGRSRGGGGWGGGGGGGGGFSGGGGSFGGGGASGGW
ncbi:MAG: TPM domain-containing protein [bacterium]